MESYQSLKHLSERELEAFGDPALGSSELERMALHLDECPSCRFRLEEVEPALSQYRQCLDLVHSHVTRVQPVAATMKKRLEVTSKRRWLPSWQLAWASGIAASAIGWAVLLSWSGHATELRAETLLAQASATAGRHAAYPSMRIRTQKVSFIRPAQLPSRIREEAESAVVRSRFAAANYDWSDPLSVDAYSAWRHSLKSKTSKVSAPPLQQIETSTDEGTLRMASLTFDQKLAPVGALFQFADQEWVEITAIPPTNVNSVAELVPAPVSARATSGTSENVPRDSLAERELRVHLAIDTLNAGASEPVEVSTSSGDILVTTYHLSPEQETRLAALLRDVPGVTLQTATLSSESVDASASDRTERLLHSSQAVLFETHLLAELADRFSPAVEAMLRESSRARLWDLRVNHTGEMGRALIRLRQQLQEASPEFRPSQNSASPAAGGIQTLSEEASALDRLIVRLTATNDASPERTGMMRQASAAFARVESLASAYSKRVEEDRKK